VSRWPVYDPDVWWVIEIVPGPELRVTLPECSLKMPPAQARRFALQLNMAADAAGPKDGDD
jgi:hypothetical protein